MIVAVGPYVGSFELEILSFRSYAKWLSKVVPHDKFYISSYHDRQFLYSWIPEENFIPLYLEQGKTVGYTHSDINHKKYLKYIREFKNKIYHLNNIEKIDILTYLIPYTKFGDQIILAKKIFEPIDVKREPNNDVLFIDCVDLYDSIDIKNKLCFVTTADFTNEHAITILSSVKAVICPIGFWTAVGNLQKCNVFSWGTEGLGKYREGGIFNFGNRNHKIVYCDENQKDILFRMINNYIAKLEENI